MTPPLHKARLRIGAHRRQHGDDRHRVVVVGGGFGGLPACRFLGGFPVEVTLVDRRNHHLFQPLLYQVATGILPTGQIAPPLRHVLRKHENVHVELAEVSGFDLDRRVVHAVRPVTNEAIELGYDSLIVATGVTQSYFGNDELALFAPGMKTIDDAMELRRRLFGAFEMAETATDPVEQQRVVDGRDRRRRTDRRRARGSGARARRPKSALRLPHVRSVDGPCAAHGRWRRAARHVRREAVGTSVPRAARSSGSSSGWARGSPTSMLPASRSRPRDGKERIAARTVIWAAGVQASPLAARSPTASGADVDRAGRIAVLPDLSLPGHPEVFAVGDMTTLNHLPGVAEVAMQGGLHAANTIVRRLAGDADAKPFKYRDLGSVAAVGRFRAICSVGRVRLSGFAGWIVWMFVHLAFLNGFGNRFSTMWRWMRSMIGRSRPERVFSVGHTGGDLSAPESVRAIITPTQFPARQEATEKGPGG